MPNLRDNSDGTCNCSPLAGSCFFTDGFDGPCDCKCHTMEVKILPIKPPEWIYEACKYQFNAEFNKGAIYTYGDTIYAKDPLPQDWIVHERVHVMQQKKKGKDEWWSAYLNDHIFRMKQELEAYRAQFAYVRTYCKDRNMLDKACREFARQLSTMYALNINQRQAYQLIKQ